MPLRLPSFNSLIGQSILVLRRFPLCLLSALLGTVAAIYLTTLEFADFSEQKNTYYFIMIASLGLTVFLAIQLFSERHQFSLNKKIIYNGGAIVLLTVHFIFLKTLYSNTEIVRFLLFNIAFHLIVSYAAFTNTQSTTGFWQFNKALFLRIFFSVIYSGTLYIGICLALVAIDQLFGVDINYKYYLRLWLVVIGLFNTWFFLAGIPKNIFELEESDEYPKGLKIFTQYVLLPLVTLYLIILYCYLGKIIITQNLPKGWVSYLVIGFSVSGILALLLIYPIRNLEGNKWIHVFSKWFYATMFPLIIMLFVAITTRITEYGITENRYFIIVIAIWLAVISFSFLFIKSFNIKFIPLSLSVVAIMTSFGPWGAFSVSERSQMSILEKTLTQNAILVDGKITDKHAEVSDSVAIQITSILTYFDKMHGFEKMKPWFATNIDSLIDNTKRYSRVDDLMKLMNVPQKYFSYSYTPDKFGNIYFSCYPLTHDEVVNVSGYDYEFNFYTSSGDNRYYDQIKKLDSTQVFLELQKDSIHLSLMVNDSLMYQLHVQEMMQTIAKKSKKDGNSYSVETNLMQTAYEDDKLKLKIQFNSLNGYSKEQNFKLENVAGTCLVRFKK